jgi:hypothetical protein
MVVAYLGGPLTHTQMNLDQDDSYNLYCAIISLNAAECVTWLQHACFKPNTEHLLLAAEEGCITASEVLILGGATPPPNGLWWMTLTQTRVLAALERVIRAVEAIPLLGFPPEIDEMIAAYTWTTRFELARKRLDCGNAESSRPFTRQFSVSTLQYTFFAAWWAVCSSANISPPSPRSAFSPAQRNAIGWLGNAAFASCNVYINSIFGMGHFLMPDLLQPLFRPPNSRNRRIPFQTLRPGTKTAMKHKQGGPHATACFNGK